MTKLYTLTSCLIAAVVGMSSCSSSKSAQTGPDMYSSGKTNGSDYVAAAPNDQYVQMKSQDYERWSYFDDYNAADAYYAPAPAYYGAGLGYGAGFGFGAPYYGFGYSPFFGPSFGLGLAFGDPYLGWGSYFMWNSYYNPFFYNSYYGGGLVNVGKSPTSVYNNIRPFNTTNYKGGLAHYGVTSASRNVVYRPGMTTTSAYNSHVATTRTTYRNPNATYRPANNGSFRTYSAPTRSYTPSFGGGGGGGFRGGGGRH